MDGVHRRDLAGHQQASLVPIVGNGHTAVGRAAAVKQYLAQRHGIAPQRLRDVGLGEREPIEGLLGTLAVYRLDRTNTRAPNPVPGQPDLLTGEQRSKGIEVGLERSISDNWQVSAGYAWQKAEILERTSACNPDVASCEVPLVPRHSFSLWSRYDVSRQFGFGIGAIARSKSFASIGNTVKLLSSPVGVKRTSVNAPIMMSGAASPIARDNARMIPVATPGMAAGSVWRKTVCSSVAPSWAAAIKPSTRSICR